MEGDAESLMFDSLLTVLERAIDICALADRDLHRPRLARLCTQAAELSAQLVSAGPPPRAR